MRAAKAAKRSAPQVTSPAWETATMAWASARVMFITDAPYPATVGHAEAKKPMAASSENRQSPEGRPEIPEVLNQRQTLLASHISSVVFQFAAETVHARIAKSEMLKPCRPMSSMNSRGGQRSGRVCSVLLGDQKAAVEPLKRSKGQTTPTLTFY